MGLDMYLYRQRTDEEPIDKQLADDSPIWGANDDGTYDFKLYDEWKKTHQVAYWRKANAIHGWFVEAVQHGIDECQYSEPFGREVLAGLVERCKAVLDGRRPATDALPTTSGFFFGSTDYDEWYEGDLRETIAQLEPLLSERNGDAFIYHSSW